jgi:hypothetical protein
MDYVDAGATLGGNGKYRYLLWREWETNGVMVFSSPCVFIMLNPSTADGETDDPTIRKCVGFARMWRYEKLVVVNLFGARATKPAELIGMDDPVGSHNSHYIREALSVANKVVCAWGAGGSLLEQDKAVMRLLDEVGVQPYALGLTNNGSPRHPLYVKYGKPIKFDTPL